MRPRPALTAALAASMAAASAAAASAAPVPAAPAPQVSFHASLSPERLGASTTIGIGFQVRAPAGASPSPLSSMRLSLPRGLSVSASELGLQTCRAAKLMREGPAGCPPNSPLGHGSATAVLPFGSQLVAEHAAVTLYSSPLRHGNPTLLVYARGEHPVLASLLFPGTILESAGSSSGLIETTLAPVPGLPEGPDVAVVALSTTIGPQGILYRERVHGRLVRFHPQGAMLPATCPRGGFRFALSLVFLDGAQASARASVPCPRSRRGAHMALSGSR